MHLKAWSACWLCAWNIKRMKSVRLIRFFPIIHEKQASKLTKTVFFLPVRKLSTLIYFDGVRNLEPKFSSLSPFNLGTRRGVQEWLIYPGPVWGWKAVEDRYFTAFPVINPYYWISLGERFSKTIHFLPQNQQCRLPTLLNHKCCTQWNVWKIILRAKNFSNRNVDNKSASRIKNVLNVVQTYIR